MLLRILIHSSNFVMSAS